MNSIIIQGRNPDVWIDNPCTYSCNRVNRIYVMQGSLEIASFIQKTFARHAQIGRAGEASSMVLANHQGSLVSRAPSVAERMTVDKKMCVYATRCFHGSNRTNWPLLLFALGGVQ